MPADDDDDNEDLETFDTPTEDDLFQQDIDEDEPIVKVQVEGVVQTDEMPTELSVARHILMSPASRAEQILNYDPRRKRAIIWCLPFGTGVDIDGLCAAVTQDDANAFIGSILHAGTGLLRYEFTFSSPLWARPVELDDANFTLVTPSTGRLIVSVVNEQWAR